MKRKDLWLAGISSCILAITLSGCASTKPTDPLDPYEDFNRHMFQFNQTIDKGILNPVSTLYRDVTPAPVRTGVTHFFENVDEMPTVFNDILQADPGQASKDTWRFIINTTIGIGGLFDVASHVPGLAKNSQNFGLTLAKWGYTSSSYLVIPIIGPSTVRDAIGIPVNYFTTVYDFVDFDTALAIYGVYLISARSDILTYFNVLNQAFDPYISMRNAYFQYRAGQIEELQNRYANNPNFVNNSSNNNTNFTQTQTNTTQTKSK